jgi:hypothetical protein
MTKVFVIAFILLNYLFVHGNNIHDNNILASSETKIISLQSFSGEYDYNTNTTKFSWGTFKEENSVKFILQRSEDMEKFDEVCTIKGAGNSSSIISYKCVDVKPLKGLSYYRLKQVNANGDEIFSPVISMTVIFPDNVEASYIIPNPNDGLFRLLVPVSHKTVQVQIFDELGQVIKNLSVENDKPNFYLSLDLRDTITKGKYYVLIEAEETQHIKNMTVVNKWESQ